VSRVAAVGSWVLAGLAIDLVTGDPLVRVLVLAAAWLLLARRHLHSRRLKLLAVGLAVIGVLTVLINALLGHTGATALVTLPDWLPLIYGAITAESFAYGANIALGLVTAISVAATLSLVIEASDLVDALPRALARTGAALGAALNLLPTVAASFVAVRDAQRLRGWRAHGVRGAIDLVVPVLLDTIERSEQLAESMEARGFGSGARTRLARGPAPRGATAVGVGSLLALAGFVAGHVAGLGATWYPYPTVSVPGLAAAGLVPAAALIVLALLVPASPADRTWAAPLSARAAA
jgi:energy-coupling factor transport system permease protein